MNWYFKFSLLWFFSLSFIVSVLQNYENQEVIFQLCFLENVLSSFWILFTLLCKLFVLTCKSNALRSVGGLIFANASYRAGRWFFFFFFFNSLWPNDSIRCHGHGEHWLRLWLVAWQHQAITSTNVDPSTLIMWTKDGETLSNISGLNFLGFVKYP